MGTCLEGTYTQPSTIIALHSSQTLRVSYAPFLLLPNVLLLRVLGLLVEGCTVFNKGLDYALGGGGGRIFGTESSPQ